MAAAKTRTLDLGNKKGACNDSEALLYGLFAVMLDADFDRACIVTDVYAQSIRVLVIPQLDAKSLEINATRIWRQVASVPDIFDIGIYGGIRSMAGMSWRRNSGIINVRRKAIEEVISIKARGAEEIELRRLKPHAHSSVMIDESGPDQMVSAQTSPPKIYLGRHNSPDTHLRLWLTDIMYSSVYRWIRKAVIYHAACLHIFHDHEDACLRVQQYCPTPLNWRQPDWLNPKQHSLELTCNAAHDAMITVKSFSNPKYKSVYDMPSSGASDGDHFCWVEYPPQTLESPKERCREIDVVRNMCRMRKRDSQGTLIIQCGEMEYIAQIDAPHKDDMRIFFGSSIPEMRLKTTS